MINISKYDIEVDAKHKIIVHAEILAPLYWWKTFSSYISDRNDRDVCITNHNLEKMFDIEDFSVDHLLGDDQNKNAMLRATIDTNDYDDGIAYPLDILSKTVEMLNRCRTSYRVTHDKKYWWQLVQLLPASYNQKKTVAIDYDTLSLMLTQKRNDILDEWVEFCKWIESLDEWVEFCKWVESLAFVDTGRDFDDFR